MRILFASNNQGKIEEVKKILSNPNIEIISPSQAFNSNCEVIEDGKTFKENAYKKAKEMAKLQGDEIVFDLYTGTGTIANFLAQKAKRVIGVEYVPEAIADARMNSELNGISNTEFEVADIKDILNQSFAGEHGSPDVVVLDPPRAGVHASVIEGLLEILPEKIIYVSCNPATQARDVALLSEKYEVTAVQPVDMFPHTHHVENIICLTPRPSPALASLPGEGGN